MSALFAAGTIGHHDSPGADLYKQQKTTIMRSARIYVDYCAAWGADRGLDEANVYVRASEVTGRARCYTAEVGANGGADYASVADARAQLR